MVGSTTKRSIGRSLLLPSPVQLVNWPLRDEKLRVGLSTAILLVAAILSGRLSDSFWMGAVVLAALIGCSWRLWIPVHFELNSKGITQTVLGRRRRIPWSAVARYQLRGRGILLLADSDSSALAAFRGVFIVWNGQRDAVLDLVNFFLAPGERDR